MSNSTPPKIAARRGKRWHPQRGSRSFIAVTLAPAVVILGVFVYWPVLRSIYLSLFKTKQRFGGMTSTFVGFDQYSTLFRDPMFAAATRNTLLYTIGGTIGCLFFGLCGALLLYRIGRGRGIYAAMMFAPYVVPWAAWTVLWMWLYDGKFGPVNYLLSLVSVPPVAWLKSGDWVLIAFVILGLFKRVGFASIIFMVGLQGISRDLYEAAQIDGAGWFKQLIHISIPQLMPVIVFLGTTFTVQGLQLFVEPFVMTQGGPNNASTSLVYMLYTRGFGGNDFGYASALAVVLFLVVFVISFFFRRSAADD